MTNLPPTKTLSLANIDIDHEVVLSSAKMDRKLEKRLLALGFSKLIPLRVLQKRKAGLVVGVGNARIALNNALAQQIMVISL